MSANAGAPLLGINLDIQNTSYQPIGSDLDTSKKYRLILGIEQPAYCEGLEKSKSDYVRFNGGDICWGRPFGPSFTLICATSDARIAVTLRQRHTLRRGQDMGTCSIDCSTLLGTHLIESPVLSERGVQIGLLRLTVTLSAVDTEAAVQQAMDVKAEMASAPIDPTVQLPPGLSDVADMTKRLDFGSVLARLDGFMKVADLAAEVHPLVKLAWGVVSVAYKVVTLQAGRDSLIQQLIGEMDESCKAAQDAAPLGEQSQRSGDIVVKILIQVIQCTYFVKEYCSERSFGVRLLRDTASLVDQQAKDYIDTLQKLRRDLGDHGGISAAATIYRVFGKVEAIEDRQLLSEVKFADKAYDDDPGKQCLDGTRTEIIEAILQWATHAVSPDTNDQIGGVPKLSARVLWLCGVAGSGKSRISRSVAARLHKLQRLGSLYCCDYKNRETLNPRSLFSTIALHLADRDPLRKQRLVTAIRDERATRRTEICRQQYQHFIVTPSADLPVVGDTVIVIDAFDEIGSVQDREDALEILTKRARELPDGLRIVVTSRFERDIQDALQLPEAAGVGYMLMEDIPTYLTMRDIAVYVQDTLKSVKGLTLAQLAELAKAAGNSFQWASTACRYVRNDNDGQGAQLPRERLPLFLGGNQGLDELYARILNEHFGKGTPNHLARLKLILGQIVAIKEPQSLRALWELTPRDPGTDLSLDDYQHIVRHLASLLVNTHDVDQPIYPFHTSLLDFLCDAERQHEYLVDVEQANYYLAIGCLEVMGRELRFNICQIPTSYKANKEIENLDTLMTENISPHLRYASNFWAQHISHLTDVSDMISSKLLGLLQSCRFLQWLEVMSVTGGSFQTPLITLDSPKIARVSGGNLISVIRDLKQFTSVFATPIHQSAPHVYLSALAFVPTSSVLHILCQYFLKMVILRQGRMGGWPRLVHVFTGHTGRVSAIAVSPDGSLVVSTSDDHTIRFWSTATSAPIGESLQGHTDAVTAVAFSPDGMCIVSGSRDNTVRLWSTKNFVAIGEALAGHEHYVISVAFSPDGTRVVSGSYDKTIRLWDTSTGSQIGAPLLGHNGIVWAVVFSPGGEFLISGSSDNTIRLWDATTWAVIGEPLRGHSSTVYCITFSPDGTRFASASHDNTIQLWDSRTFMGVGKPLRGHFGGVRSLAFSPDSTLIASGSEDETIRVWDVRTGAAIGEPLRGHMNAVSSLAFLPDGSQPVSGSFDKTIRLWNTTSGAAFGEPLRHTKMVTSVSFSGDGKYIASCSYDKTIRVWDTNLGIPVGNPLRGHDLWVNSVAFSPNSTLIASGSNDGTVRLWKAATGELVKELTGHSDGVKSVVFSPDSAQIVSGSYDKTIRLWNVSTGETVGKLLSGHRASVASVAISPDGTLIVSGSGDQTMRMWDLKTGAMIGAPLEGHDDEVNSVAISPDGTKIASAGSNDKTIRLWSVKSQAPIGKLLQGRTHVMSVTFSHDGAFIVSGFADGIQLWDVEKGINVGGPLSDHTGSVTSVACSPDGIHIASGSRDGSVRLWNMRDILARDVMGPAHDNSAKSLDDKAIEAPSTNQSGVISPSHPDATAQYPPPLFPNQTFTIRDGWILGPNDELLLWVPPANRSDLLTPSSRSRILGVAHPTELDFSHFKSGMEWMQCRDPINTE